ncbi:S26 family signal peptidase [uncultured Proteiniphilum sp.]|mgnify:FL=1|uniref:S26 family signal peptidase n=1 Tax=uncultured Proteiniphilum sp. TaxID=497637 RepID=UPI002612FE4D|nr:S26 family signal peptidase [uncultured Proteiniphilum sp.]
MNKTGKIVRKTGKVVLNLFYYTSIVVSGFIVLRVFVFGSYKILAYGARLFDLFSAVEGKEVKVKRMPGYTRVKHNDVVVFHIPYPNKRDKIEMHMLKYYIKRCIGVPGDTLRIVNGIYSVNADTAKRLGNYEGELAMSRKPKKAFPQGVYNAFPGDTVLNWNIKDFGPLYIPRKGDRITLDRTNALLYKKIIEWEKGYPLPWENDTLRDNGNPLHDYTFSHNYYFMGGDRVENSRDSRYWGLLPDDLVVGKAWLVWKSVDTRSGTSRRKRILKKIE